MEYAKVVGAFGVMHKMPLTTGAKWKQIEFGIVLNVLLY
jgi:hypothetical protein